jgi:serine/threonine protein kinase
MAHIGVAAYVWHDSQATVLKPVRNAALSKLDSFLCSPHFCPQNEEISQHFMIGAEIGKGNFSTVHVGHNKRTKEKVAIKIINKKRFWNNTKTRAQILREVEIIRGLNHPHIIQYKAVYDSADHLYLVLEMCEFTSSKPSSDVLGC